MPTEAPLPTTLMAVITNNAGYNGIAQRIHASDFSSPDPRHDPREGLCCDEGFRSLPLLVVGLWKTLVMAHRKTGTFQ